MVDPKDLQPYQPPASMQYWNDGAFTDVSWEQQDNFVGTFRILTNNGNGTVPKGYANQWARCKTQGHGVHWPFEVLGWETGPGGGWPEGVDLYSCEGPARDEMLFFPAGAIHNGQGKVMKYVPSHGTHQENNRVMPNAVPIGAPPPGNLIPASQMQVVPMRPASSYEAWTDEDTSETVDLLVSGLEALTPAVAAPASGVGVAGGPNDRATDTDTAELKNLIAFDSAEADQAFNDYRLRTFAKLAMILIAFFMRQGNEKHDSKRIMRKLIREAGPAIGAAMALPLPPDKFTSSHKVNWSNYYAYRDALSAKWKQLEQLDAASLAADFIINKVPSMRAA